MGRKSLYELLASAKKDDAKEFLLSLTNYIEKRGEERPPSANITPSSLKCIRQIVYKLLSTPVEDEKRSYNLKGITEVGIYRHETLQEYITQIPSWEFIDVEKYVKEKGLDLRIGEKTDHELHLYDDKNRISYMCDGIIKNSDGKYFILEIKTMMSMKFMRIKDEIPDEYKLQATCYSYLMQIPDVMFLFEDRDLLTKKAMVFTPTQEEKNHIRGLIYRVNKFADENIIPEKPDVDRKVCQYCRYKKRCNSDGIVQTTRENN